MFFRCIMALAISVSYVTHAMQQVSAGNNGKNDLLSLALNQYMIESKNKGDGKDTKDKKSKEEPTGEDKSNLRAKILPGEVDYRIHPKPLGIRQIVLIPPYPGQPWPKVLRSKA